MKRSCPSPNDHGNKRRYRLGYDPAAVACGHCRRKRTSCIRVLDGFQNCCSNCIRLKMECHFHPIDQQATPGPENRRDSLAHVAASTSSLLSNSAKQSAEVKNALPYLHLSMPLIHDIGSSVKTPQNDSISLGDKESRAPQYVHSSADWIAIDLKARSEVPFSNWEINDQESPLTLVFSPFASNVQVSDYADWTDAPNEITPPSTPAMVKTEDAPKSCPSLPPIMLNYNQSSDIGVSRSTPSLYANGSAMLLPTSTTDGYMPSLNLDTNVVGSYSSQHTYPASNLSFESRWHQVRNSTSDALIINLALSTHPGLDISSHFHIDLPLSPMMAQQSITISLSSTHYYLQIRPAIAPRLLERQHKLFVTSGTQRLHAVPGISGRDIDPCYPLFETRLLPGVNRIEVELIATLLKGTPKLANGSDAELEKIIVFANLLRN